MPIRIWISIFLTSLLSLTITTTIAAERNAIRVKFKDGLSIQLINGVPSETNKRALTSSTARIALDYVENGIWYRSFTIDDKKLSQLSSKASRYWGKRVSDLRLYYNIEIPTGVDPGKAAALFKRLSEVAYAYPIVAPVETTPPDYSSGGPADYTVSTQDLDYQGYLGRAGLGGIGASTVWSLGGTGNNINISLVEYTWDPLHQDIPTVINIDPHVDRNLAPQRISHGTNAMGVLAGIPNNFGITGIAPLAQLYISPIGNRHKPKDRLPSPYWSDECSAILNSTQYLSPGDVILIEVARPTNISGFGHLPVEFDPACFEAIKIATGNQITVVEPGGNRSANLDDPRLDSASVNLGINPFKMGTVAGTNYPVRVKDSGAIIVGAGRSPVNSFNVGTNTRAAWNFSTFGGRVDLQGWGDAVVTAGGTRGQPGDLYNAEGSRMYKENKCYHPCKSRQKT